MQCMALSVSNGQPGSFSDVNKVKTDRTRHPDKGNRASESYSDSFYSFTTCWLSCRPSLSHYWMLEWSSREKVLL